MNLFDKEAFALEKIASGPFRWDEDFVLVGPRGRIENTMCGDYRAATFFVEKGKRVTVLQHRLVYAVFVSPIPKGLVINHKDGDKKNNNPSNLELVTPYENAAHSLDILGNRYSSSPFTRGHANINSKLTPKDVYEMRLAYSQGETHRSLAKKYSISTAAAYFVVRNKSYFDQMYTPRSWRRKRA